MPYTLILELRLSFCQLSAISSWGISLGVCWIIVLILNSVFHRLSDGYHPGIFFSLHLWVRSPVSWHLWCLLSCDFFILIVFYWNFLKEVKKSKLSCNYMYENTFHFSLYLSNNCTSYWHSPHFFGFVTNYNSEAILILYSLYLFFFP